jgi:uncharacterized protein with HEPN domain
MKSKERDADLLRLIPDVTGLLRRQAFAVARASFLQNSDQTDAAEFRLAPMGEWTKRLGENRQTHPDILWDSMIRMRNVLSHACNAIKQGWI